MQCIHILYAWSLFCLRFLSVTLQLPSGFAKLGLAHPILLVLGGAYTLERGLNGLALCEALLPNSVHHWIGKCFLDQSILGLESVAWILDVRVCSLVDRTVYTKVYSIAYSVVYSI